MGIRQEIASQVVLDHHVFTSLMSDFPRRHPSLVSLSRDIWCPLDGVTQYIGEANGISVLLRHTTGDHSVLENISIGAVMHMCTARAPERELLEFGAKLHKEFPDTDPLMYFNLPMEGGQIWNVILGAELRLEQCPTVGYMENLFDVLVNVAPKAKMCHFHTRVLQ